MKARQLLADTLAHTPSPPGGETWDEWYDRHHKSLEGVVRQALGSIPAEIDKNINAGGLLKKGLAITVAEKDVHPAQRALKRAGLRAVWRTPTCIVVESERPEAEEAREVQIGREILKITGRIQARGYDQHSMSAIERFANELIKMHSYYAPDQPELAKISPEEWEKQSSMRKELERGWPSPNPGNTHALGRDFFKLLGPDQ
jgi:hypothetical protein